MVGCDVDDEVVDVAVGGGGDVDAVEFEEDGGGEPSESLVAVDQRVVVDDRLQERGGLGPQVRVGVAAASGGLGSSDCGSEQADVADRDRGPEESLSEPQDVVEVEVLDGRSLAESIERLAMRAR